MKSWWGKDTDQNISARSLTLLIFAVEWALCGRRSQPQHESVMPLLSFCPLNVLTLKNSILCQETSSESGLLHTFIYSQAFNNNLISNCNCCCCNDTFADIRFTSLLAKNISEEYKSFLCCYNYHFISCFVWNIHSDWLLLLRVMQENNSECFFFWTPCIFYGSVSQLLGNWISNFGRCATWERLPTVTCVLVYLRLRVAPHRPSGVSQKWHWWFIVSDICTAASNCLSQTWMQYKAKGQLSIFIFLLRNRHIKFLCIWQTRFFVTLQRKIKLLLYSFLLWFCFMIPDIDMEIAYTLAITTKYIKPTV